MKKILMLIFCAMFCFSLVGCGDSSPITGTWKYSIKGNTSTVKFSGRDKVVWTMEVNGKKTTYEGTYSYDEEKEEVTVELEGWGSGTYDVSLSIPQIDFADLPHRK